MLELDGEEFAVSIKKIDRDQLYGSVEVEAYDEKGNPASISDVGVGLLAVRACIEGAAMNVRINLAGLKDESLSRSFREKMQRITAAWFAPAARAALLSELLSGRMPRRR